ncbi:hypothetical protein N7537_000489 [Penicillium hordei]|jgi:hypothetical protein|uniref:Uncharacterized protein n=1 Tax=Penicillium hordei TaxID=40994 RepID=A0AAD6H7G1_9EURO|nr:uncharacterized protein N7537_000489 [Penicillium hordei]KAJ5615375.1 hypothetical protein N7537_000489 [Penicillium hordei]
MAPAIREVTQTLIEADTTFVSVITLENTSPWPTLNLVTWTATTPFTTVIHVVSIAETPTPEQTHSGTSSGLSDGNKGAIAGCILGAVVFLLLLYYLYLCRLQSRALTRRSRKVPVDSKDPTPPPDPDPDPDPHPADEKPAREKKTVTISSDLPRYFRRYSRSKDDKSYISPLVRISTEMNLRTKLQTREGRLGQPVRFMIRSREKQKPRKKRRRSHRRRSKRKSSKTDMN